MMSQTFKVCSLATLGIALISFSAFACNCPGSEKSAKAEVIGASVVQETVKSSPSAVIAFHSSSCGTCKVQKPRLQSLLLKEQNSQIKDVFLDFDNEEEVRKSLKVAYPSTVIVFKNGTEVGRVTGETNEVELQKLLNKSVL